MPRRAFISLILKVSGNVNADAGIGTRIPMKKIVTWNKEVKAFVSPRCIRRCIRERLYEKGFEVDPLVLEEQLVDAADPVKYVDDDFFGYLAPAEVKPRAGPIKVSHLIALRHTEVKVEFAARFAREFIPGAPASYPVPFEIETAEWLGRLDVIVSERVGVFSEGELTERVLAKMGSEYKDLVEKFSVDNKTYYRLKRDERIKRLRAFLEILLWEGWQFPRGAESSSVPEYYYGVIALTERFVPMFGYVDVDDYGRLREDGINAIVNLYGPLIDRLIVLDYREKSVTEFVKSDSEFKRVEKGLDHSAMEGVLKGICEYIVR